MLFTPVFLGVIRYCVLKAFNIFLHYQLSLCFRLFRVVREWQHIGGAFRGAHDRHTFPTVWRLLPERRVSTPTNAFMRTYIIITVTRNTEKKVLFSIILILLEASAHYCELAPYWEKAIYFCSLSSNPPQVVVFLVFLSSNDETRLCKLTFFSPLRSIHIEWHLHRVFTI